MGKLIRRLTVVCLILLLCLSSTVVCMATENACSLTVDLKDDLNRPIDGLKISLCKIASPHGSGYVLTEDFAGTGIAVNTIANDPSPAHAKALAAYVEEQELSSLSAVSEYGQVFFSGMDEGIWLAYCKDGQMQSFEPFFVFLPLSVGDTLYYDVKAAPKTGTEEPSVPGDGPGGDSDEEPGKQPDGKPGKQPNGKPSKQPVEKPGKRPVEKPSGASKLPQTGQLWWPVGLIGMAGLSMILLGIMERKDRKHGQKTK